MSTTRSSQNNQPARFLPVSRTEMEALGWDRPDFILVTGDAYVDHPSFGAALIGRWLEFHGYRVAILPQPDWKSSFAYKEFGRPALGFLVTAGNLDSILSNYTASLKPRHRDSYSPGGIGGRRPDHASVVYANRIREAYKGVPIILGGIEASLRRFAHYDLKDNRIRRSILFDSRADVLVYGLAENSILEIATRLKEASSGLEPHNKSSTNPPVEPAGNAKQQSKADLTGIRGTAIIAGSDFYHELQEHTEWKTLELDSFETVSSDMTRFAHSFLEQEKRNHTGRHVLVQPHGDRFLIQYPPGEPLGTATMDRVFSLPFARRWHPTYDRAGGVPAIEEVLFSITSHRGCYGGCSFCALTFHQGKTIQKRSAESILQEARLFTKDDRFKGYIHDVGGPTANFRENACEKLEKTGPCPDKQCVGVSLCNKIEPDHSEYLDILRNLRSMDGIKKVFIRSGIRYDYLMEDKSTRFLEELCEHHVSGQLKVAPEHASASVLKRMNKPSIEVYHRFKEAFLRMSQKKGKKQFMVPYLMSSHPGSTLHDAIELAEHIREWGVMPEQVQDFIPAPGSLSTAMFVSGIDPRTGEKIHIPRSREEKEMQRALLQFSKPENYNLVRKALRQAGREDLIGRGKNCLIPEDHRHKPQSQVAAKKRKRTHSGKRPL